METDEGASSPRGENCMAIGCLVAAAFFYLVTFAGTIGSDTHNPEDGMLVGFAMLAEIALWIVIGLFVLLSAGRAGLPRTMLAGSALGLVLAGFASVAAFAVMGTDPSWVRVTPILLPPLAVAFGFRAARGMPGSTALTFAAAASLLCLPPVIAQATWISEAPDRDAARAAEERQAAEETAAVTARYQALDAQSPLENYLVFINQGGLYWEETRQKLRRSPRRQADVIRLLDAGRLRELHQLHDFALEPDATLCARYGALVDRTVVGYRRPDLQADEVVADFYDQLPNVEWLTASGCDLSAPFNRLFEAIRRMPLPSRPDFMIERFAPLAARGTSGGR